MIISECSCGGETKPCVQSLSKLGVFKGNENHKVNVNAGVKDLRQSRENKDRNLVAAVNLAEK